MPSTTTSTLSSLPLSASAFRFCCCCRCSSTSFSCTPSTSPVLLPSSPDPVDSSCFSPSSSTSSSTLSHTNSKSPVSNHKNPQQHHHHHDSYRRHRHQRHNQQRHYHRPPALPIAFALLVVVPLLVIVACSNLVPLISADLISQSVTNLPAAPPPSLVEQYQLENFPEQQQRQPQWQHHQQQQRQQQPMDATIPQQQQQQQPFSYALSFQELLYQKRYGNRVDQCPCVVLPGSDKCMAYDGRYQAELFEEAMLTFVDNSMDPRIFEQRLGGAQISFWTLMCRTEECHQCVGMLVLRLRQIGLLREPPQFPFPVPGPSELRPLGCPRLRISRFVPIYPPPPSAPAFISQLITAGASIRARMQRAQLQTEFGQKVQQALSMNRAAAGQPLIGLLSGKYATSAATTQTRRSLLAAPTGQQQQQRVLLLPSELRTLRPHWLRRQQRTNKNGWLNHDDIRHPFPSPAVPGQLPSPPPPLISRIPRQASSTRPEPIIGERYVINCVERGEAESDQTDLLNLCTTCWTWRQLPEDYFPRLINELVCQENDFCLSGWGICHQRYRNFDVLQRVRVNGQEEWRPTTISAASCCDCKVKAGSQAHSLVVGGKT